jgi:hypothetical protein
MQDPRTLGTDVTLSPASLNRFVIGAVASGEAGAQYGYPLLFRKLAL